MQELPIPDQRMLILMEYAVRNNLAEGESDYWEKIGFNRTSITQLKRGQQSFRVDQITNACKLTGASADWVHGLEKTMFREKKGKSVLKLLKEATAQLEEQLKNKRATVLI